MRLLGGWRRLPLLLFLAATGCRVVSTPPTPPPAPAGGRAVPQQAPPEAPGREVERVGPEAGPSRHFSEVRGVWVVRTQLESPDRVENMVKQVADAGFNTIMVQVRGRADAFYHSRWEPPAEQLADAPAGFDPLALVIRQAHARGLAVHAWVNTHLVWGGPTLPSSPDHMVNARPDWLAVPKELGRELYGMDPFDPRYVAALRRYADEHVESVEGLFSSPSNPGVQERVYDVWMDLVEHYELDGIHFDYIRYPNADFDYSRSALDRFRAWVIPRLTPDSLGVLDVAFQDDPYAFVDALPDAWDEFRRAQITQLVERGYYGVKARRPDVLVSAAVFPDADDAYRNRYQDWRGWLRSGFLDVAVPMAYTTDDKLFLEQVHEARGLAGSRDRVWAGIGAWANTFDGTLSKIDIARREDVGGVVLFSYDWASTEGPAAGGVSYLERVGRARFEGR
jgi:uncharacterized lipoprotein YddW (UPF0748 family)